MTVGELIDALAMFPRDMQVKALWDTVPSFDVHRVEPYEGVALIDCGSGDGDWEDLMGIGDDE